MTRRRKPLDGPAPAAPVIPEAATPEGPAPSVARIDEGYGPAMNAGFQAAANRVQEMQQAISSNAFESLLRLPGFSVPTRIAQGMHDAIAQGVYAAVRHGGGAAFTLAGGIGDSTLDADREVGSKERALRSAINGALGDSLMASGNALSVQMSLHRRRTSLKPTRTSMAGLRPHVALFLHGLACDEQSWSMRADAWKGSAWEHVLPIGTAVNYGTLLEHELDISSVHLRYNTGLSIDNNATQLSTLLERAVKAAPQVEAWLPIGHSMGGLVARRAFEIGRAEGLAWPQRVPMIVCLGSPHRGAPLEKLGHLASAASNVAKASKPLARGMNARGQGTKDLRHALRGIKATRKAMPALRMIYATLGDESDAVMGALIGKMFGDGLVMAGSAADDGPGDLDVQRVEVPGLGHMGLLNHPRVYAVLRGWLGAAPLPAA